MMIFSTVAVVVVGYPVAFCNFASPINAGRSIRYSVSPPVLELEILTYILHIFFFLYLLCVRERRLAFFFAVLSVPLCISN